LAIAAGLFVALLVAAALLLQVPAVGTWTARRLAGLAPLAPGWRLEVGRASGTWFTGLRLENLVLRHGDSTVMRVAEVRLSYPPLASAPGSLRFRTIAVTSVSLTTRRDSSGWDLAHAMEASADTVTKPSGRSITIDSISVGDVDVRAWLSPDSLAEVRDARLEVSRFGYGSPVRMRIDTLLLRMVPPSEPATWFDFASRGRVEEGAIDFASLRIANQRTEILGRARLPFGLDSTVQVNRLDVDVRGGIAMADVAAFSPTVNPEGRLDVQLRAQGVNGLAVADLDAGLGEARLEVEGRAAVASAGPRVWRARGRIVALDPSRLYAGAGPGRLDAELDLDLEGPRIDRLDGEMHARVTESQYAGATVDDLALDATFDDGAATFTLDGQAGGGTLAVTGTMRPLDSLPTYRIQGSASALDGTAPLAAAIAGGDSSAVLHIGFELSGSGIQPATAKARGSVGLAAVTTDGARTEVGAIPVSLGGGRVTARPALGVAGGTVGATAIVTLGEPITWEIRDGRVSGVALSRMMGDTAGSGVSGTFAMRGSGSSAADLSAAGSLELADIRYGSYRVDRVIAAFRMSGGLARADTRIHLPGGGSVRADLSGRLLDSVPKWEVQNGEFSRVDFAAVAGRERPHTDLNGRYTASGSGLSMGTGLSARVELNLGPSKVNEAELRDGAVTLTLDQEAFEGDVRLEGAGLTLVGEFDGTLGAQARTIRATGALSADSLALWLGEGREGALEARFALDAAADSTGLTALAGDFTGHGTVGTLRIESLEGRVRGDARRLIVDTLLVRSNAIALAGRGPIVWAEGPDTSAFRLQGEVLDPAPLAALFGTDSVSLDTARLGFSLTGPGGRSRFEGDARIASLLLGTTQLSGLDGRVSGTLAGKSIAAVEGALGLTSGVFGSMLVRQLTVGSRWDSVVTVNAEATLGDSVSVSAALSGRREGDSVRAVVERLDLTESGRQWALRAPAPILLRPRVEIPELALESDDRRITVRGTYDSAASSDVTLELVRLDLGMIKSLGLAPVGGRLDGTLHYASSAGTATASADVTWTLEDRSGTELGTVATEAEWSPAGLVLDTRGDFGEAGGITVQGFVPGKLLAGPADSTPVTPADTIAVAIQSEGIDFAALAPLIPQEMVENPRGRLTIAGSIRGSVDAPRAEGTFRLEGGGGKVRFVGVDYKEVTVDAALAGDRFDLTTLRVLAGDGPLTGSGGATLRPLHNPSFDFTVDMDRFRVADMAQLRTSTSGQLRLSGTAAEPSLTGSLRLGETDVWAEQEGVAATVDTVTLTDADLQALARDFGPRVLVRQRETAPLERFHLDLEVEMPGEVWIRRRANPKVDIEMAGRVKVTQEPGEEMQFAGTVRPVPGRGYLGLYGRQFRLVGGEITLDGPPESARFDIDAEYQVPAPGNPGDAGVVVTVNARGQLDSLALDFSSEPSMSRDDIVSYIITGRPASDNPLAEGGGSEAAAGLAVNRLAESLSSAAGEAVGLDVFQIKQEGLSGLTLVAGRYVASRLFLSLEQPLQVSSSGAQQTTGRTGPGFEVEYGVNEWLRTTLRAGNRPVSLFLRGRYAY
jgi:autotransporter translocation and assembly factor TamB